MATLIILSHNVKDFDGWKKGFEAHAPARAQAGLEPVYMARDLADPSLVHGAMKAPSVEVAKAFLGNPDLKAAMEASGVSNMKATITETF